MSSKLKILKREISDQNKPFVVLEISANHGNSFDKTIKTIDAASKIGAECVKFQTFNLDDMTLNISKKEFLIKKKFSNNRWNSRSLYSLYSEAQFPYEWHKEVFYRVRKKNMICFSSVFDEKSLEFLEKLNCPAYKIASLEALHFSLISKVFETKKPVIISTGTLTKNEIKSLVNFIKKNNFKNYSILHCVSEYPTKNKNVNLKMIDYLKKKYKCVVGFSDHTRGIGAAISSVAYGANIIEKHFKLKEDKKNLDNDFSITPEEAKILISEIENAWLSIGSSKKRLSSTEKIYKEYRRSVYVIKDINKGELITKENIKVIRPGKGYDARKFQDLLGKKSKKFIKLGSPLSFKV